jgi:predicted oxidoreductase (fatty acid repression mutant protein)
VKQIFVFLSLLVVGVGAYLKFFNDVPDNQEQINFFVSWFLIIVGISSLLINLFWNTRT